MILNVARFLLTFGLVTSTLNLFAQTTNQTTNLIACKASLNSSDLSKYHFSLPFDNGDDLCYEQPDPEKCLEGRAFEYYLSALEVVNYLETNICFQE